MDYVDQEIIFTTECFYGEDVPLSVSSPLLRRLESTARPSVRMILEGTSSSVGTAPAWLDRASDIRILGFSAKEGATILHVRAPRLGDAASNLFDQQSPWPNAASPDDTALQVIGKIAKAIRRQEVSSDLYDRALLKHFSAWSRLFRHELDEVEFCPGRGQRDDNGRIDRTVTANAQELSDRTPPSRQVRIVGQLDMVGHSTRSFGLVLDGGEEVRGVLMAATAEPLQQHLGKQITVLGRAIYRPSGKLLRLDASEILPTADGRYAFSKIPPPSVKSYQREDQVQIQRSSVDAFFGTWPGEETDAELLEAVEEVRR